MTKPLLDVLPAADPVRASLAEGKHETCAVVGNGGSLLLYRLGAAVDAHDVVIRLNGGPTKSFEQHVGRKTTFRYALCAPSPFTLRSGAGPRASETAVGAATQDDKSQPHGLLGEPA